MEKKRGNKGLLWAILAGIGTLAVGRKTTTTKTVKTGTATLADSLGGGGGSVYNPPVKGFVITGVGQTVTGLTTPQTVQLPVRVINLTATPAGIYSGSATLRTANGTVLHTETITDLNISSGAGAYPAIYFNPRNPVWGITGAGVYSMLVSFTIEGVVYSRSVDITLTNEDLNIVSGGTSGVTVLDYAINNGNQVVLSLTGGTAGQNVTVQLKQGETVVGSLNAAYASSMTVNSSQYGYCEIVVDGTDIGAVYIPQQIAGAFTVERAKAENDGIMSLDIAKVGSLFIITDSANTGGWANVEYWHNSTFLGASIPANYAIEPNVIHHLTKKVWQGGGNWISYEGDPNPKQKRQQTIKIVST